MLSGEVVLLINMVMWRMTNDRYWNGRYEIINGQVCLIEEDYTK